MKSKAMENVKEEEGASALEEEGKEVKEVEIRWKRPKKKLRADGGWQLEEKVEIQVKKV